MSAYNFAATGSNVTKHFHATCRDAGVLTWAPLLGKARPLKFRRAKTLKFRAILDNYRIRSRISPEWIHIWKIGKVRDERLPLLYVGRKKFANFGPQTKELYSRMLTHPSGIFRETTFRPIGGAGPSNFYTR